MENSKSNVSPKIYDAKSAKMSKDVKGKWKVVPISKIPSKRSETNLQQEKKKIEKNVVKHKSNISKENLLLKGILKVKGLLFLK